MQTTTRAELHTDQLSAALIEHRDNQIAELHDQVQDVNNMFKEIQQLVESQQPCVDNIQSAIENTNKHVDIGVKELEEANEKQKNGSCIIL